MPKTLTETIPKLIKEPTVTGLPYRKKLLADQPEWIGEWERVKLMRQKKHSLAKGGQWKEIPTSLFLSETVLTNNLNS